MVAAIFVAALVAVHVIGGQLRFLNRIPRSVWLSAAGGVSVAYVCVHLLPEIADAPFGRLSYAILLMGLVVFYTLETHVRKAQRRQNGERGAAVFLVSMASYAVYNALIGYSIFSRDDVVWFGVAMVLHFLVNDHGLRQHHRGAYDRMGRWMLAAALIVGAGAAIVSEMPEWVRGAVLAFVAGGVLLNVFKEELPSDRESRPLPFIAAAALYAALLLALD